MKTITLEIAPLLLAIAAKADDYDDGKIAGRDAAEKKWNDEGYTCTDAWKFEEECDIDLIDDDFAPVDDDNWREADFKEGARVGVQEVVDEKEKECFEFPDTECTPLGESAANAIARREVCPNVLAVGEGGGIGPDWKKECRASAIDTCEAYMDTAVQGQCGGLKLNTPELNKLKPHCVDEVDSRIDWNRYLRN